MTALIIVAIILVVIAGVWATMSNYDSFGWFFGYLINNEMWRGLGSLIMFLISLLPTSNE